MTIKTLSEQFQFSMGSPIEVNGRKIHSIYTLDIAKGVLLNFKWLGTNSDFRQGIKIKIDKGVIDINGTKSAEIILWEDTSPLEFQLFCIPRKLAKLKLWNVWEVDSITQAWVGNAGIDITERKDKVILKCSDGAGGINFDNNHIELTFKDIL